MQGTALNTANIVATFQTPMGQEPTRCLGIPVTVPLSPRHIGDNEGAPQLVPRHAWVSEVTRFAQFAV